MAPSLPFMMRLARDLLNAESDIDQAETNLKVLCERARVLREETLVCAMQELDVQSLTLSDGGSISLKQAVYASIPKDRRDEAYTWLEEHKHGGIIKTEVTAVFGKNELKAANLLRTLCEEHNWDAEMSRTVHAGTLKAWVKAELEAGRSMPVDLFGVRSVTEANVKGIAHG